MSEENNEVTETAEEAAAPAPAKISQLPLNGGSIATSLDMDAQFRKWPDFSVGDTVKVHYRIKEGDKERVQVYEGTVISIRGDGMNKTFIVRRVSHEVGVERIFPYHSPSIQKIETTRRGRVRRAKLFYLRHKSGKEGRIKEVFDAAAAEEAKKNKKPRKTRKKKAVKAPKAEPAAVSAETVVESSEAPAQSAE